MGSAGVHVMGVLFEDAERQEVLQRAGSGVATVRVRALSAQGEETVRAQMQMLAALEVEGVGAAPAVLEVEPDGYTREAAVEVRSGGGRRSAIVDTPSTTERLATARARTDLEALLDALHDRGWVLGAPLRAGLAVRPDGSVTVRDLSGLRRDGSAQARWEDRRWVDSVLNDQSRTLRRRVDETRAPSGAASGGPRPGIARGNRRSGDEARVSVHAHRPTAGERRARQGGGGVLGGARLGSVLGRRWRDRTSRSRDRSLRPRDLATIVQPEGHRWLTGILIATAGICLGVGIWLLDPLDGGRMSAGESQASDEIESGHDSPEESAAKSSARTPAPRASHGMTSAELISDPEGLATQLGRDRHSYVTGQSDAAPAAEGSPAAAQDEAVREAYLGLDVQGGEPELTEVIVAIEPTDDGRARLQGWSVTPAHRVVHPDGSEHEVPATTPELIQLDLVWDGLAWRVENATVL